MPRKLTLLVLSSFALLAAACASVGGRYTPPAPAAPAAFSTRAPQLDPGTVETGAWWTRFDDPALTGLVEEALRNNLDVREAVQRVEAARAVVASARQESLPAGGLTVAKSHQSFARQRSMTASAAIEMGWEVDLFGRIRSLRRGADAEVGAAGALLSQARLLVAADVARTWFALRATEARIELRERYRADQAELVNVLQARVEEGAGDEADLARARAELASEDAALANERHDSRVLQHALAVLVGAMPGAWQVPQAAAAEGVSLKPIAIGDPAALLQRRPDVRAAERALAAQTADIGVATSALFPRLTGGGFFGLVAGTFGDLGETGGESWSIGPSLSWGIFDLGRVRAQIRRERAEAEGALAAYERTVLRALEDTENAFSAFATAHETLAAADQEVTSARIAADLVDARYEAGMSGYFEALDAHRSVIRAEISRIDGISAHRTATVDVFRALGGDPAE